MRTCFSAGIHLVLSQDCRSVTTFAVQLHDGHQLESWVSKTDIYQHKGSLANTSKWFVWRDSKQRAGDLRRQLKGAGDSDIHHRRHGIVRRCAGAAADRVPVAACGGLRQRLPHALHRVSRRSSPATAPGPARGAAPCISLITPFTQNINRREFRCSVLPVWLPPYVILRKSIHAAFMKCEGRWCGEASFSASDSLYWLCKPGTAVVLLHPAHSQLCLSREQKRPACLQLLLQRGVAGRPC